MTWYEFCLFAVLLITVGISAYTDIKNGKVKNILLLMSLLISLPIQVFACASGIVFYVEILTNVAIAFAISLLFYAFGFWAAGDSKLLMTISLIFPYTLYWNIQPYWVKSLSLILFFIATTYVYIIVDTILNVLFNLQIFLKIWKKTVTKFTLIEFAKKWCVIIVITNVICALNKVYIDLSYSFVAISIFFAYIMLNKFIEKAEKIWYLALIINILTWFFNGDTVKNMICRIVLAVLLFILSKAVQAFNYKIITTKQLRESMIISALSIQEIIKNPELEFLRNKSHEDMKARLNIEEVELIKNVDIDNIRIVRKLPFAAFISVACLLYLVMGRCYAI